VHERSVESIYGAGIVFVDERTGEEGDGVHDRVLETGRHNGDDMMIRKCS